MAGLLGQGIDHVLGVNSRHLHQFILGALAGHAAGQNQAIAIRLHLDRTAGVRLIDRGAQAGDVQIHSDVHHAGRSRLIP